MKICLLMFKPHIVCCIFITETSTSVILNHWISKWRRLYVHYNNMLIEKSAVMQVDLIKQFVQNWSQICISSLTQVVQPLVYQSRWKPESPRWRRIKRDLLASLKEDITYQLACYMIYVCLIESVNNVYSEFKN